MPDSLDIEELNRTRIALGMAPLPVPNSHPTSTLDFKNGRSSAASVATEDAGSTLESREAMGFANWQQVQDEASEKKKREAARTALKKQRDAAQRFARLEGQGLGDEGGDGNGDGMDTRAWILGANKRRKRIEKARALALQRELEERENAAQYTEGDLKGLKVGHEVDDFDDETEHIVTLKDRAIGEGDEDEDDVLESADLRAREELTERLDSKKKKAVYDPHAEDGNENGERNILGQYDEEIKGKKQKRFTLDGAGRTVEEHAKAEANGDGSRNLGVKFSLDFLQEDNSKSTSDYMDVSEIKIRKPKKKKDRAKRRREDDDLLTPGEQDRTPANGMDIDESTANPSLLPNEPSLTTTGAATKRSEPSFIDDDDLQSSLALQRRAALKKRKLARPEDVARQLREEENASASATPGAMDFSTNADTNDDTNENDGGLIIDETSEFVANLQKPEARPARGTTQPASSAPRPAPDHDSDNDDDADGDTTMHPAHDRSASPSSTAPAASTTTPSLTTTGLEAEATLLTGLGSTLKMLTGRGLLAPTDSSSTATSFRDRQRFLQEKSRRETATAAAARAARERDRASGRFERMSSGTLASGTVPGKVTEAETFHHNR